MRLSKISRFKRRKRITRVVRRANADNQMQAQKNKPTDNLIEALHQEFMYKHERMMKNFENHKQ